MIVLFDTCVLIRLNSKKYQGLIQRFIKKYLNSAQISISEMSKYELLRTVQNRAQALKKLQYLSEWTSINVDTDILRTATYYYNLLSKIQKVSGSGQAYRMNQFSDTDIIIAATAVHLCCGVCTFDRSDFPCDFFLEKEVSVIEDLKLYLLVPDLDYFEQETMRLFKT